MRIGYLSPDFQRYPGPGYHFLLPPLTHHDRTGFEILCCHNDTREDEATRRFQELADGWRPCAHLSDEALDARIRADGVDILVGCGGHMARNRMPLFLGRPAPVRISFPLYPNTTGLTAMDYQFAAPLFAPPAPTSIRCCGNGTRASPAADRRSGAHGAPPAGRLLCRMSRIAGGSRLRPRRPRAKFR